MATVVLFNICALLASVLYSAIHDFLMTEKMLAYVGAHLGVKDLMLCAVSDSLQYSQTQYRNFSPLPYIFPGGDHVWPSNVIFYKSITYQYLYQDFPYQLATIARTFLAVIGALARDRVRARCIIHIPPNVIPLFLRVASASFDGLLTNG